jgi:hypothetical protein
MEFPFKVEQGEIRTIQLDNDGCIGYHLSKMMYEQASLRSDANCLGNEAYETMDEGEGRLTSKCA